MSVQKITAANIKALLSSRHSDDVAAAECPTGASGSGQYGQMDFWAMKKAWSKPMAFGYEVKVSRSDFVRDDKWPMYLPFCNQFYFVVAQGVCDLKEIPDTCGMILVSKTRTRLYTKKKAPVRIVNDADLAQVYKSLLINRASLSVNKWTGHDKSREERIEQWKLIAEDRSRLALHVKKEIRGLVSDALAGKRIAEAEVAKYESFRKRLIANGIDPDTNEWRGVKTQVDRLAGRLRITDMMHRIDKVNTALSALKSELEAIEKDATT